MDIITSRNNQLIIETSKLKDRKYRDEKNTFLFEGIKLTREALASNVEIIHIFLTEKCSEKYPDLAENEKAILISDSVLSKISENNAPEGIVCTAKYMTNLHKKYSEDDIDLSSACLILSTVQDPGNLGTIARTSSAFGKKTLILSNDCADIYNQKTIRASMGALFRTAIYRADDLCKIINDIKEKGVDIYAAALDKNAKKLQNISNIKNSIFVLGNEGHGLSKEIIDSCLGTVIIPMEKDAESLNVASAASIVLWEVYR